jgi:hypothetical protein
VDLRRGSPSGLWHGRSLHTRDMELHQRDPNRSFLHSQTIGMGRGKPPKCAYSVRRMSLICPL